MSNDISRSAPSSRYSVFANGWSPLSLNESTRWVGIRKVLLSPRTSIATDAESDGTAVAGVASAAGSAEVDGVMVPGCARRPRPALGHPARCEASARLELAVEMQRERLAELQVRGS